MNEEQGRLGQKRYSGIFYEEFLRELQGKRGVRVYQEKDSICLEEIKLF